ncbi:MAG: four helix bundle protein [Chthoniobacterales bacterium]
MGYNVKKGRQSTPLPAGQFRTFEDLEVYQVAREFRKKMYGVTRQLPDLEKFELASQIRRAAVSLTNNIAEGHGRYHFADQVRFFLGSRGSLQELIDDLNTCADENYLKKDEIADLKKEAWRVLGLINGYLRYLRNRKTNEGSTVREIDDSPEEENALATLNDALEISAPF